MANVSSWTISADFNNSAAPDGFPEGMAPSGVNDAAREVMAAVRRYAEDAAWFNWGHTPVQQTSKSFLVSLTATHVYTAGRRLRLNDATTILATVEASSPSGSNTVISITGTTGISSSLTSLSVAALRITEKSEVDLMRMSRFGVGAAFSLTHSDLGQVVEADATGGSFTLSLPATVPLDQQPTNIVAIMKTDSTSGVITVAGNGQNINGRGQEELVRQWDQMLLMGTRTSPARWQVISGRKTFVSAEISVSGAALYSVAHNGGTIPFWWGAVLRNVSAELGYASGDEVVLGGTDTDNTGAYNSLAANGTTLYLGQSRASWPITRRDTGGSANITTANWRLVFKARWEF